MRRRRSTTTKSGWICTSASSSTGRSTDPSSGTQTSESGGRLGRDHPVDVELLRDAPAVGVGRIQSGFVFFEIHADQEDSARPRHLARLPQKNERLGGSEVADGGAGKKHRLPADRHSYELGQGDGPRMVGADADDVEEGKATGKFI